MNKDEMIETLKSSVVLVDFTKVSGEKRIMKCTLKSDVIPPKKEGVVNHRIADDVIAAWDVDNNGWRSFKIDSVNSFSVE
jgi:hypothetical protein